MLYSKSYQEQLKQLHSKGKWGNDGHKWVDMISPFIFETNSKTVLDYGCGKGSFKTHFLKNNKKTDITIYEYDPGIKGKDKIHKAEFVVCTDVLEHIEPEIIDNVIKNIYDNTINHLFLNVDCKPARTILPDGRNAHLIIEPPSWWVNKIKQYFKDFSIIEVEPLQDTAKRLTIFLTRNK